MDDTPRPLTAHLGELRRRLFWVLGTWALFAGVAGSRAKDVFELLTWPAVSAVVEKGHTLIAIAPPELFFTYVKSAILAGFMLSLPMTLYQAWMFVAPGLYANERRLALPFVFDYFIQLEAEYVVTSWTMQNVFTFLSRLYLAFGIAFELPVAILFLTLAGIVTPATLARGRPYAVVGMFVVAAILTPPDIVSQILLAVPLLLLYESGIWISRLVARRRSRTLEGATAE